MPARKRRGPSCLYIVVDDSAGEEISLAAYLNNASATCNFCMSGLVERRTSIAAAAS